MELTWTGSGPELDNYRVISMSRPSDSGKEIFDITLETFGVELDRVWTGKKFHCGGGGWYVVFIESSPCPDLLILKKRF